MWITFVQLGKSNQPKLWQGFSVLLVTVVSILHRLHIQKPA